MKIKKNTAVLVPVYALHRQKELFGEDAEDFNPDRFIGTEGKKLASDVRYQGFGGGPRSCLGKPLAIAEIKVTLAKILGSYELEDAALEEVKFKQGAHYLIKIENDVKIGFRKRPGF